MRARDFAASAPLSEVMNERSFVNPSGVGAAEGLKRFNTFAEGPCPVLEAFVSAALADAESLGVPSRSRRDAPGRVVPKMPVWSGRPRPALRVLTRMRESFGRQM
jgi:hypothetical protein